MEVTTDIEFGRQRMFRITIAFLMGLVMQSTYGKELFSADVEGIKQVAIDAALLDHPELLPGDLDRWQRNQGGPAECVRNPDRFG